MPSRKTKDTAKVENSVHPVPDADRQRAYLNDDDYQRLFRQSVENPDEFWGEQAKGFVDWFKPWHCVHHRDL
ncbi:acetyl-coenzyme A synthetase N-terminal domain-containing protein, partial [Pseudomonas aeruginosa]|uniref:acetyl-coenzyme A synthetase N-terminal domain-containing protein n=1 Tax=Pseudomonas aeruginosa TaxID=287 RepID=UPI003CC57F05